MTEPNEREKKLAREHSLVTGDGEDDSGTAIGHLLARYRAELLKPENVMREAERLLAEAAARHGREVRASAYVPGRMTCSAPASLTALYAALVQSGKGE